MNRSLPGKEPCASCKAEADEKRERRLKKEADRQRRLQERKEHSQKLNAETDKFKNKGGLMANILN